MDIYGILRLVSAFTWLLIFIWLFPAVIRNLFGRGRNQDDMWSLHWFMAVLQVGFAARFIGGLTAPPAPGVSMATATGLQVIALFLGFATLWKRYYRLGFRF